MIDWKLKSLAMSTNDERKDALLDLAKAIEPHIADECGWVIRAAEVSMDQVYLDGPNGMALRLDIDWRNLYLQVSGKWPKVDGTIFAPGGDANKCVGVSVNREPAAIGKDINRRLVKWYVAEYTKHARRRDLYRINNEKAAMLRRELAPLTNAVASFRVNADETGVSVDVHAVGLEPGVAREVLGFLANLKLDEENE